jgi:ubiquinone/menaquinone biosynthesis C-methylase UbiE
MSPAMYAIRGGKAGARRLDLLARVMGPTTEALLDDAGIGDRRHCVDVGCGGGHVARSLAARVGSKGRVLGLDFDPVKLQGARREARRAGLTNVEFLVTDVTSWAERSAYDAVYGRFIVSHLPERPAFVARLAGALRPGGVLVLEDIDFTGSFCRPASRAFDRYCDWYTRLVERRGGDANAGGDLYGYCLDAGLRDVRVRVVQPIHGGRAAEKELTLSTLVNIADNVVLEGLGSREDVDEAVAELTAFTADPRSVTGCPRVFQVWGRRRGR